MNVYVDGTFDLFHTGHLRFLEKAKSLGEKLIVGIISDENAATYKRKPVIPCIQRRQIVEALEIVDLVIEDCPFNIIESDFLDYYEIGTVVYGGDPSSKISGEDLGPWEPHYFSAIERGILRRVPYSADENSTTNIIKTIRSLNQVHW